MSAVQSVEAAMSQLLFDLSQHPLHQSKEPLTAAEVISFCNDACLELQCSPEDLPGALLNSYQLARRQPSRIFGFTEFVDRVRVIRSSI